MATGLERLGLMSGQANAAPQREDDLLTKIRTLLEQYLQLGGDTPVATEAQALMQSIDNYQSGTDTGSQDMGPLAGLGSPQATVDAAAASGDNSPLPKTYDQAQVGAKDFLKKANKKKAKATP